MAVLAHEILRLYPRRGCPKRPVPVTALGRLLKKTAIDVGAQNRDVPGLQIGNHPAEQHGNRIWLLARAAARTPESQAPFRLLAGTDEFRKDAVLQDLKRFSFTEEIGFANREVAGQNLHSRLCPRRRNERSNKGLQISGAKFSGRTPDATFQVVPARRGEMQAQLCRDELGRL